MDLKLVGAGLKEAVAATSLEDSAEVERRALEHIFHMNRDRVKNLEPNPKERKLTMTGRGVATMAELRVWRWSGQSVHWTV
jgi:hypothetical protein